MNENNNPIEITESSSSLETPSDISQKNTLSVSHTGFTNLAVSELLMAIAATFPLLMSILRSLLSDTLSEGNAAFILLYLVPAVILLGLCITSAVFAFRGFRQLGTVYSDFNRLKKLYVVCFILSLVSTCILPICCFESLSDTLYADYVYCLLQALFLVLQGIYFYRIYTYTSRYLRSKGNRYYVNGCLRLRTAFIVYIVIFFLGAPFLLPDISMFDNYVSSELINLKSLEPHSYSSITEKIGLLCVNFFIIPFYCLTRLYYATLRFLSYVKLKNIASVDIKNETGENANC